MSERLKQLLLRAELYARGLWQREPVAIVTTTASVVVFLCAKFGVVVPQADVVQALAAVLPILFGGAVARQNVTPV
jgi:hypothetical protein